MGRGFLRSNRRLHSVGYGASPPASAAMTVNAALSWFFADAGAGAARIPATRNDLCGPGGGSGGAGSLLSIFGALVHNIDAVPASVGNDKTEPESHDDDGHNPQDVDRQPNQAQDQCDGKHAHHHGVWALLLAEHPRKSIVQPRLRGRRR